MHQLTQDDLDVLLSYAKQERSYRSMSLDRKLKHDGYLQWKDRDFNTGQFEISPKGEEALLESERAE